MQLADRKQFCGFYPVPGLDAPWWGTDRENMPWSHLSAAGVVQRLERNRRHVSHVEDFPEGCELMDSIRSKNKTNFLL